MHQALPLFLGRKRKLLLTTEMMQSLRTLAPYASKTRMMHTWVGTTPACAMRAGIFTAVLAIKTESQPPLKTVPCAEQDRAEAIKWLLRAANNGHTKAQVNLGGMHFTGTGVARNLREAVMWVQLALGSRARRRRRYLQPSRAPGSQPDPNAADRHCRHYNLAVFCQSCKVQQPKW